MMTETKPWLAIVNPQSAHGRTGKVWPRLYREIIAAGFNLDYVCTQGPDDATLLAAEALGRGQTRLLAVGGDGTVNEVLNGFFRNGTPLNPEAKLAIYGHGTGGDFLRTLGRPRTLADFLQVLAAEDTVRLDVGEVNFLDARANPRSRYFINVADVGLGGETAARVNRHSKRLGGRLSFLCGAVGSIITYRNKMMSCSVDGRVVAEGRLNSVMVANGRFFGGGMQIAPGAEPTDGLLDVVVLGDFSTPKLLYHLPKIYGGRHLGVDGVALHRGREVVVEAAERALLELDGEQPGETPVKFTILPAAIQVIR